MFLLEIYKKLCLLLIDLFLLQFNAYESILALGNMDSTTVGIPSLQFDPDKYPHATLKHLMISYNSLNFVITYSTQNLQKLLLVMQSQNGKHQIAILSYQRKI